MDADRTAADAFGLLSDETRLDVLRTVAAAQFEAKRTGVAGLSFSDIYERVDVDDTSKLSYHLGELTGTFLRKHEGGYAFTHAGERLVRFVLAENYREPRDFGAVETDGVCLHCGAERLQATLHEQYFFVRCADCDRPVFSYRIQPALLRNREGTDLIDAVVREQVGDFCKMRRGVCPDCGGTIEGKVEDDVDESVVDGVPVSYPFVAECEQCLRFLGVPLPHAVAYHPASVAFHWERGVDVLGTGVWELHRHLHDGTWTAERVEDDAAAYRVEYRYENATLRLFLDERTEVVETERVRRENLRGRDF